MEDERRIKMTVIVWYEWEYES